MLRTWVSCLFLATAGLATVADANWPERLEDQRRAFRDAWPRALDGDDSVLKSEATLLADYPLYPDLQAAWLRTQLGATSDEQIRAFIATHGEASTARTLRYRWALSLAKRGLWKDYLAVYNDSLAGSDDERLDCLALRARLATAADASLVADASRYWLHGRSRPDQCDPVFDWLQRHGHLNDDHRRQRVALALEKRQFDLATWLSRSLDESDQELVQNWRRMRHRPAQTLQHWRKVPDTAEGRELVLYGLKRLARSDFDSAAELWPRLSRHFSFDAADRRRTERSLAYIAASNREPGAITRILQLGPDTVDDSLLETGARVALRDQDWATVIEVIDSMSQQRRDRDEWRYWRARGLEAAGNVEPAAALYRQLAAERSFYGFLAADRVELPYAYNHVPAVPDEGVLEQLQTHNGLVRAREMFFVDLHGPGRSEWDRHTASLSRPERAQSAIMASRWGWHSVAISTASRAGLRDDLSIRYPMAFRETFETHTSKLDLPTTWAFGIARSESLFMPDVASSAGALGVMQLMPETGRLTARQARVSYSGRFSLLDPDKNIALGTYYLDKMYSRFDDHQVLATAAYNAGPHRVDRWLPDSRAMPADVWVETVPFRETRGYLRRVLAADVIFHWRLTGETRRLAAVMAPVRPAGSSKR